MQTSHTVGLVFAMTALLWPTFSSGESSSNAKVCGYLPIPELEAHFGAKATVVRGNDSASMSMCAVHLPDVRHVATVISNPPAPAMTIEQRLAVVKRFVSESKNLGSVGCFSEQLDMGDKVPSTTCFLDGGHYLSLALISDNPKQLSFEPVKQLLEKAAARRK